MLPRPLLSLHREKTEQYPFDIVSSIFTFTIHINMIRIHINISNWYDFTFIPFSLYTSFIMSKEEYIYLVSS